MLKNTCKGKKIQREVKIAEFHFRRCGKAEPVVMNLGNFDLALVWLQCETGLIDVSEEEQSHIEASPRTSYGEVPRRRASVGCRER